jgi:predicted nucleic acid-binding protein
MILDSSCLVVWLFGDEAEIAPMLPHLVDKPLRTGWVQLAEMEDVITRKGLGEADWRERVEEAMEVVPQVLDDFIQGARVKTLQRKSGAKTFSLIDGIICATAHRRRETVLTLDLEWEGIKGVTVLQQ